MQKSRLLSWLKREQKLITRIKKEHSKSQQTKSQANLASGLLADIITKNFVILLALAIFIATFGLLSNSAASIIGGMIIAPLMTPIVTMAFSLVIFNLRLLTYSGFRLLQGIALTIFLAYIATEIIGFRVPSTEILARTEPTLLDLGVAIAAGVAGAFARIHRNVSDTIPGVAIAVALVPPLCVVGICIAIRDPHLAQGAFILFLTNLFGIILSAMTVFLCHSYGDWKKSFLVFLTLLLTTFVIGFPLNSSFRKMIAENKIRDALHKSDIRYSREGTVYINSINVKLKDDRMLVTLDIVTQSEKIKEEELTERLTRLRNRLSNIVGEPVALRIRSVPVKIIEYRVPADDDPILNGQ